MSTISNPSLLVKCPHCSGTFTPEDAIGHDIRIQLEKEFEQKLHSAAKAVEARVVKQESDRYREKFLMLEEDRKIKTQRLQEFERNALALAERERHLKDKEETMEVDMKRRLLEREKLLREQADKFAYEKAALKIREEEQKLKLEREQMEFILKRRVQLEADKARDEERMKQLELQKKLDDQAKLINEMKRKSEQGSMQTQGEVQELAIETYLETTFMRDEIEEISKGKRGGDCIHVVKDHYGNRCGSILYESKRTKHFSNEWIPKIKDDQRLKQADIAVIVTEALPEGMSRFGELDGVWVCSFSEFKALAVLLRQNLARIGEVLAAQENRGDKMQLIYSYVTSNEFKQKLEASFESYHGMQEDLLKEKTMITAQWAKREKRLLKAMENLVSLYGDVRGIAGGAVQEIKALEIPDLLLEE
ncbi:DUF2130 domain-containing protein [Pseudochryseolinea flava]|nr:DUF2130 domain-containing protein [Pseudochryseolinea flava]